MEASACIGIFILIGVLNALMRWGGTQSTSARTASFEPLRMRVWKDYIHPDGGGPPWEVLKVSLTGVIAVPRARAKVAYQIRAVDVTDGSAQPLLCPIPGLADDSGAFSLDVESMIPYQVATVEALELPPIPVFALLFPRRGQRRLQVSVSIVSRPGRDAPAVYATTTETVTYVEDCEGYLDREERSAEQEQLSARLALALAASDGKVDKRESEIIRQHFRSRFAGIDEEEERRDAVNQSLHETFNAFIGGQASASALLLSSLEELKRHDDRKFNQEVFELCMKVVAADEHVDKREQQALDLIQRSLEIDEDFARTVREKNLRLKMFGEVADEEALDMPKNLSKAEKLAWIAKEYDKWRGRVNHRDSGMATEATRRLDMLAKLRVKVKES